MYISLGMLVPSSKDQQGKLWLPNILEVTLQYHVLKYRP